MAPILPGLSDRPEQLRAVVEVNDRMEALTGQELDSAVQLDAVVERDMSGADVA